VLAAGRRDARCAPPPAPRAADGVRVRTAPCARATQPHQSLQHPRLNSALHGAVDGALAERPAGAAANAPPAAAAPAADSRPDPHRDGAVVLLYDDAATSVRLHDVVDVLGILDPLRHAAVDDESDADSFDELDELVEQENAAAEGENSLEGRGAHGKVRAFSPLFCFVGIGALERFVWITAHSCALRFSHARAKGLE
jgi:hypothetical protein